MPGKTSPPAIRAGPAGLSYMGWTGIVYPKRTLTVLHEATYLADYFEAKALVNAFQIIHALTGKKLESPEQMINPSQT